MKLSTPAIGIVLLGSLAIGHGQTIKLTPEEAEQAQAALELRLNYAASKEYDPYNPTVADAEKKCSDLMKQKSFAAALKEAERGLREDRYNINLLITKTAALHALGREQQAEEVRRQWRALMDSILMSGDGKDFATAFRVISVDEEYSVLRVLQIERVTQALAEHGDSQFDVFSAKDAQSGKEFQVYFNIDVPMKWLHARFEKIGKPNQPAETPAPAPPAKEEAPRKP